MSRARCFLVAWLLVPPALALAADKEEKKDEKKPDPPRVALALPFAVSAGSTNRIVIRGQHLTNATELRFTNTVAFDTFIVSITNRAKADVPKEADAKKVGDSRLDVEVIVPAGAVTGTNWFTVMTPDGISEPRPLLVLPAGMLIAEQEPNGGFKQAQIIEIGRAVTGLIQEAGDVDVFRFEGSAGETIRVEVVAAAAGSALDSLVSVQDAAGRILATNDDASGQADSILECDLPKSAAYYINLTDAHDKAGPTHAYLLRLLRVAPAR